MNGRTPVFSGSSRHSGLAAVFALLVAVSHCTAETLTGTVVDPQQRRLAGAVISLHCGDQTEVHRTDSHGEFSFSRETFPGNCSIAVSSPGFATLERAVGRSLVLVLQLRLASVRQTVSVSGDAPPRPALTSVSLNATELRSIPGDARDWVNYAEQLAGAQPGSDRVYVDGLPTDTLPPASTIERIIVNADPFSAEYSDGSNTHIDIITRNAERKLDFQVGGLSFGPGTGSVLGPHLDSTADMGNAMLTSPVPYLPLAFTVNGDFDLENDQIPIQAVVPSVQGSQITPVDAAPATIFNRSATLSANYLGSDTLRVNTSWHIFRTSLSNMDVSGLTLPDAGMSKGLTAREFRATLTKLGSSYVYRGGVLGSWSDRILNANSSSLGVSVQGAFVAGGADIDQETGASTRWTFKNVLELNPGGHLLSIGVTATRAGEGQFIIPNPFGRIQFDDLEDYVASANTGAPTGTWFLTRGGGGPVHYVSYNAAPFVEGELVRSANFSLRAGLRADCQTGGGVLYSPRLSAATAVHSFVLRAGSGLFVQNWPPYVFVQQIANDGHHLEQLLATNVSLYEVESAALLPQSPIVSQTAADLAPAREWVSKASIERKFAHIRPGLEYTWTVGTHLLGSQRLTAPVGWTDLLASNRASRKDQVHVRVGYEIRGQSFTAHYEWIHARDNTDGPFSYPAQQNDLRDEWGPSSNVSPHNVTLIAHFKIKTTSLTLLQSMRSAVPLNITSGLDPAENGLYTDRGGRPRNSGTGPAFHSLALYGQHLFAIPKLSARSTRQLYLDTGLHVENLLNNRNYITLDGVAGSPLFGQPLSALPGRCLRVSLGIVPR
ncbi:exported hypothetical protein [Candidatus Sulfotelmatobacter kueseliae]|uniref:TonB-dependent receptor-like beta-barrel domain-containing protein n=1 Tax=Candidatus Sulfotelmatobacter kueseliae TaxID=2042962 RepID=A0A2U3KS21_9BACT|nr:exported hypothetical protein [Candidatus Sulfotelmatobacter kueseliae]